MSEIEYQIKVNTSELIQVINKIGIEKILLSFLIALVSQQYQFSMDLQRYNGYKTKAFFNHQFYGFMSMVSSLPNIQVLIITRKNGKDFENPGASAKFDINKYKNNGGGGGSSGGATNTE